MYFTQGHSSTSDKRNQATGQARHGLAITAPPRLATTSASLCLVNKSKVRLSVLDLKSPHRRPVKLVHSDQRKSMLPVLRLPALSRFKLGFDQGVKTEHWE